MNKSVLITIIVVIALVIGGGMLYANQQKQAETAKMAQDQAAMKMKQDAAMKMKDDAAMKAKDSMKMDATGTPGAMMKDTPAMQNDKAGDAMMKDK